MASPTARLARTRGQRSSWLSLLGLDDAGGTSECSPTMDMYDEPAVPAILGHSYPLRNPASTTVTMPACSSGATAPMSRVR
jgi:hypothetical protein